MTRSDPGGPTWQCPDCDTYNAADAEQCMACSQPREGAAAGHTAVAPIVVPALLAETDEILAAVDRVETWLAGALTPALGGRPLTPAAQTGPADIRAVRPW